MKRMRLVMTQEEAIKMLRREKIKLEYPLINLPSEGPGLKVWIAIDCLSNYHTWNYLRKKSKQRKEREISKLNGPNVLPYYTDNRDKNKKGEIMISQLMTKNEKQCSNLLELLAAFNLNVSDYERLPI